MNIKKTPIENVFVLEPNLIEDSRGFFTELFNAEKFKEKGLETKFVQVNNSLSVKKRTLRGMHYQLPPYMETKIVRCIKGSIYDVALDLRKNSPTFGKYFGTELTETNRKMMYIGEGMAHGFLTLSENSEIIYLVSNFYSKEYMRGIMWNDPKFNIEWKLKPSEISERDKSHPLFNPEHHLFDL